jgi:hypothetical protein
MHLHSIKSFESICGYKPRFNSCWYKPDFKSCCMIDISHESSTQNWLYYNHTKTWHKQHNGGATTQCQKCEVIKDYPKDTWFKKIITGNITPLLKSDGLWWKDDKLVIPNDEKLERQKQSLSFAAGLYLALPMPLKCQSLNGIRFQWIWLPQLSPTENGDTYLVCVCR